MYAKFGWNLKSHPSSNNLVIENCFKLHTIDIIVWPCSAGPWRRLCTWLHTHPAAHCSVEDGPATTWDIKGNGYNVQREHYSFPYLSYITFISASRDLELHLDWLLPILQSFVSKHSLKSNGCLHHFLDYLDRPYTTFISNLFHDGRL